MLVVELMGCATSRILTSWRSKDIPIKNYSKILVLGLNTDRDPVQRERMEQHMAGDLVDLNYVAIAALQVFDTTSFKEINEMQRFKMLADSGFDAVLTVVLLNQVKEQHFVPGKVNYLPNDTYRNQLWGYYNTVHDRIFSTGYYVTNTKYFWESNFYDLSTGELVYSVQTESFDPASAEILAHEYGQMIVKDMIKNNVLAPLEKVSVK